MNCEHARQLIGRAMDDELAPADRELLEAHLASCSACSALAAQYRAMLGGFEWLAAQSERVSGNSAAAAGAGPAVSLPPAPPRGRSIRFPAGRWGAGLAAAAAVTLLVLARWPAPVAPLQRPSEVQVATSDLPAENTAASGAERSGFELRLIGDSRDDYIAVPQPQANPRVHLVWLHRTAKRSDTHSDGASSARQIQLARS